MLLKMKTVSRMVMMTTVMLMTWTILLVGHLITKLYPQSLPPRVAPTTIQCTIPTLLKDILHIQQRWNHHRRRHQRQNTPPTLKGLLIHRHNQRVRRRRTITHRPCRDRCRSLRHRLRINLRHRLHINQHRRLRTSQRRRLHILQQLYIYLIHRVVIQITFQDWQHNHQF